MQPNWLWCAYHIPQNEKIKDQMDQINYIVSEGQNQHFYIQYLFI